MGSDGGGGADPAVSATGERGRDDLAAHHLHAARPADAEEIAMPTLACPTRRLDYVTVAVFALAPTLLHRGSRRPCPTCWPASTWR